MKKYKTRSGREVNIWTFNSYQKYFPIRGEIQATNGSWGAASWKPNFSFTGSGETSDNDLVEVHPCADLKHGDAVMVWDDSDSNKHERNFIGYAESGTIYVENGNGNVTMWLFGEPA